MENTILLQELNKHNISWKLFFPKIMLSPLYSWFTLFFPNIILDPFKIMRDSRVNPRFIVISTSIPSTDQPNEECSFSNCPIFFSDFLILTEANDRNQNSWKGLCSFLGFKAECGNGKVIKNEGTLVVISWALLFLAN